MDNKLAIINILLIKRKLFSMFVTNVSIGIRIILTTDDLLYLNIRVKHSFLIINCENKI